MTHSSLFTVVVLAWSLCACGAPFSADPFTETAGAAGAPSGGSGGVGDGNVTHHAGAAGAAGAPSGGSGGVGDGNVTHHAGSAGMPPAEGGVGSTGGVAGAPSTGCGGEETKPIDLRACIERIECGKYAPFAGLDRCKEVAQRLTTQNCPPTANWVQNECTKMTVDFIEQMDCSSFAGCIP